MADQPIHQPLSYSEVLKLLTTADPGHADTFNPLFERLVNNDAFIKAFAETLATNLSTLEDDVETHKADDAAHGYHGKSIEYDWNTDNLVIQERHFDAIGGSGGIGNLIKQIDYTWNTDGTVQSEAYTLKDYDTGGTLIRTRQFTISYTWNTDKLPTLIDISDITEV